MNRRHFLKDALAASVLLGTGIPASAARKSPGYQLQLDVITEGFDGTRCWIHPRAGVIPGAPPTVVLTLQRWLTGNSDYFLPLNSMFTRDLGRTWSPPVEHDALGRRSEEGGVEVGVCDFTPKWHARSRKLLGIGHTVRYHNNKLMPIRARETAWSVYDPAAHTWTPWRTLAMPPGKRFENAGAGCVQRVDLKNGDILLPIYFKEKTSKFASSMVARCTFDGDVLRYVEHGSELTVPVERGLGEPSLTWFDGRYYLTLRNDQAAYVATSKDGLRYTEPKRWTWDDGADLGSYNTQAHWVTHSSGLFLTYTRRGANNDHVVRHRAPIFLAEVDPKRLVVRRDTERVLVPNQGASLGNYGVVEVSEKETWVTTSEGMGKTARAYGANGRVYAARILWDKPNRSGS